MNMAYNLGSTLRQVKADGLEKTKQRFKSPQSSIRASHQQLNINDSGRQSYSIERAGHQQVSTV
jgi:hypothetical protein